MSLTKQTKQTIGQVSTNMASLLATTLRKPAFKAFGTRVGILQDWRAGSNGKAPARLGKTLRDGR